MVKANFIVHSAYQYAHTSICVLYNAQECPKSLNAQESCVPVCVRTVESLKKKSVMACGMPFEMLGLYWEYNKHTETWHISPHTEEHV